VYVRIAFPPQSEADVVSPSDQAPADAVRTALAVLASFTATPATGYAAIWEGWVSSISAPQAPRVEIPNRAMLLFTGPVEALRDAPALAWYGSAAHIAQEPHLVWPEDQAWCLACEVDEELEFTVGCPTKPPKLWLAPCRALFDECAMENRLPCTATRPSANIALIGCERAILAAMRACVALHYGPMSHASCATAVQEPSRPVVAPVGCGRAR
jgi:hypothetical protein